MKKISINFAEDLSYDARIACILLLRDAFCAFTNEISLEKNQRQYHFETSNSSVDQTIEFPDHDFFEFISGILQSHGLDFNNEENMLESYFKQVQTINLKPDHKIIFLIQHTFRGRYSNKVEFHRNAFYTIDAEDQHAYFDNTKKQCTNIFNDDLDSEDTVLYRMLNKNVKTLATYGISPIFLYTGSDLSDEITDFSGSKIQGTSLNLAFIEEMDKKNLAFAGLHSMNHEFWLSKGNTSVKGLNWLEKMFYVLRCSLNPRTFYNYFKILLSKGKIRRTISHFSNNASKQEFIEDYKALINLISPHTRILPIYRSPGFRINEPSFSAMSELNIIDSSRCVDWKKVEIPLIGYTMTQSENDFSFKCVRELPCIFIDDLFRYRFSKLHKKFSSYLSNYSNFENYDFTICSHTKILGTNEKHAHYLGWDPRKGLALPALRKPTQYILREISSKINWNSSPTKYTQS